MERNFTTTDKGKIHDTWFRAKVEAALASQQPTIPHDQVIAELQGILDVKRSADTRLARRNADRLIE